MSRSTPTTSEPRGIDYVFKGGRYAGYSVKEVLDVNAGYILWLQRNTDMDFHHEVVEQAEETPIQT